MLRFIFLQTGQHKNQLWFPWGNSIPWILNCIFCSSSFFNIMPTKKIILDSIFCSSQYIELPSFGSFGNVTMEFWMLPEAIVGEQYVYEALESAAGAVSIVLLNDQISLILEGQDPIVFSYHFLDRIWSHIAFAIDTSQHTVRFYVDGTKVCLTSHREFIAQFCSAFSNIEST
jgi:hypothetical protein